MPLSARRRAFPAVLVTALCACLPASAETAADVARLIGHEQSALARVAELGQAMRPRARDDNAVTVASRSVEPGTVESLAAVEAPARLDLRALDALPSAAGGGAELHCLAQAIYFESRGEPLEGQIAVAEVVLNRTEDHGFPDTVCGVTNQGVGSGRGCQFSYACDGNSDVMKSAVARERSVKLAGLMLAGRPRTLTDGATYFHTRSVKPSWARKMTRTNAIGHHLFYRAGTRVAGG
jgi:spore germination cell wall hydrolase CwlJ-like protein